MGGMLGDFSGELWKLGPFLTDARSVKQADVSRGLVIVPLSVVSVARTQGLDVGNLRSCWVVKDHSSGFIGRKGVYMLSLNTQVWDVVVAVTLARAQLQPVHAVLKAVK
jgi:hypothetical protein